jgi:hypothetical protein
MEKFSKEDFDRILEEVGPYQVNLEEDPTLPHLKQAYLMQVTAKCRQLQNQVQHYLHKVGQYCSALKREIRYRELDLDLKMSEKIADSPVVKQGSAALDRRSIAVAELATEHSELAERKVALVEAEETYRLLKMKYDLLRQTSNDIRLQRSLVRDDLDERASGNGGYSTPSKDNKSVHRTKSPVNPTVDAADLIDPKKRPEDMPPPINTGHAQQMAAFLNAHPRPDEMLPEELSSSTNVRPEELSSSTNVRPEEQAVPKSSTSSFYESLLDD